MMEEILSFFDDENFSAVDYIDSLYTNSIQNDNLSNNNNISILSKNFSNLLNNLQLYSNTMQLNLNKSFEDLGRSCSLIGAHQGSSDKGEKLSEVDSLTNNVNKLTVSFDVEGYDEDQIMRLQYYTENLLNLVYTLTDDAQSIIKNYVEVNSKLNDDHLAINTLINLKKINSNLLKVSKQFQTAKFISTISLNSGAQNDGYTKSNDMENDSRTSGQFAPTSSLGGAGGLDRNVDEDIVITPEIFKNSLDILEEIIVEQLQVNRSIIKSSKSIKSMKSVDFSNKDLIDKIDSLVDLKLFFKNLNYYDTIYLEFIGKLEKEKQSFVSSIKNKTDMLEETENNVSAKVDVKAIETSNTKNAIQDQGTLNINSGAIKETGTKESSRATKTTTKESEGFGGFMNFFNKNL